jgi:hypothetical protein
MYTGDYGNSTWGLGITFKELTRHNDDGSGDKERAASKLVETPLSLDDHVLVYLIGHYYDIEELTVLADSKIKADVKPGAQSFFGYSSLPTRTADIPSELPVAINHAVNGSTDDARIISTLAVITTTYLPELVATKRLCEIETLSPFAQEVIHGCNSRIEALTKDIQTFCDKLETLPNEDGCRKCGSHADTTRWVTISDQKLVLLCKCGNLIKTTEELKVLEKTTTTLPHRSIRLFGGGFGQISHDI